MEFKKCTNGNLYAEGNLGWYWIDDSNELTFSSHKSQSHEVLDTFEVRKEAEIFAHLYDGEPEMPLFEGTREALQGLRI